MIHPYMSSSEVVGRWVLMHDVQMPLVLVKVTTYRRNHSTTRGTVLSTNSSPTYLWTVLTPSPLKTYLLYLHRLGTPGTDESLQHSSSHHVTYRLYTSPVAYLVPVYDRRNKSVYWNRLNKLKKFRIKGIDITPPFFTDGILLKTRFIASVEKEMSNVG